MSITDFDTLCRAIIEHIEQDCPEKIERSTPLLEKELIDSFTILGLIVLLEDMVDIEVQPDQLATKHFASVETTANWALNLANQK